MIHGLENSAGDCPDGKKNLAGMLRSNSFHIAIILLVGFIAYSNSFQVPFTFDDHECIVNNPAIKVFSYFTNHAALDSLPISEDIKNNFVIRFIAYFTFALNFRLHGLDVTGYHVVNLTIHLTNAVLVYSLLCLSVKSQSLTHADRNDGINTPARARYFPFIAALLFVSHPVQTQAVTYIVQRFTSMATMFFLCSLVAYIKSRQARTVTARTVMYALSISSALAAMWTKEIAFTLPVIIALYDYIFLGGDWKSRARRLFPFILTMLAIPLTLSSVAGDNGKAGASDFGEVINLVNFSNTSHWGYLVTQFRVIATYIRLLFFPVSQNLDYEYPLFNSLLVPEVFASFLLIITLLFLSLYLLFFPGVNKSFWPRTTAFGLLWFFITLSVESSFIPINDVIFEHRTYLPSIGFIISIMASCVMLVEKFSIDKAPVVHRTLIFSVTAASALVVLALTAATYLRNEVWRDSVVLWKDVSSKSPNKARPHTHLGNELLKRGFMNEAILEFKKVLSINPNSYKAHNSLGIAYTGQRRFGDAQLEFDAALKINPDDFLTHRNRGYFFLVVGRPLLAISEFRIAAGIEPNNPEIYLSLGNTCLESGFLPEALSAFQSVLSLQPYNADARRNLARVFDMMGLSQQRKQ